MATKYNLINELYEQTLLEISSPNIWTSFLKSACKNYKCRFDEQVLIYAQNPNATAVLQIEKWNTRFKRWVNKGANGIAVLDMNSEYNKLKYYFDVSDTHASKYSIDVPIWEMGTNNENAVIKSLEDSFGTLEHTDSIISAVESSSRNIVNNSVVDYISEYVDDETKNIITYSIAYMTLSRLGIDADKCIPLSDLSGISNFSTKEQMNAIGYAVSELSKMQLTEIANTVKLFNNIEHKTSMTYNKNTEYNIEGSFENGRDNIQQSGRLQYSEHSVAGGRERSEYRENGKASQEIPRGTQQDEILQSTDVLQAQSIFIGDRGTSEGYGGAIGDSNGESTGSDRTDESGRYDEMGGNDEQHTSLSTGNSPKRVNLPTIEEQLDNIENAESNISAFSISQEEIDAILTSGSGFQDGKYRIYEQLTKNKNSQENINFLKGEYGIGGSYPALDTSVYGKVDQSHDGKGIRIAKGSIMEPNAEVLLTWNSVNKRIAELIALDRYLSDEQKNHYPTYLLEKNETEKRWEVGKEFNSIIMDYNGQMQSLQEYSKCLNQYVLTDCGSCFAQKKKKTGFLTIRGDFILPLMLGALNTIIEEKTSLTDRAKSMIEILNNDTVILPEVEPEYEYVYHLGDTIHIGNNKYEVLAFNDDEVRLYDTTFPIFNKVYPKSEFDLLIKENPYNDHLKLVIGEDEDEPLEVLSYQVGDFFEFYGEDAVAVSKTLDIALLSRTINNEKIQMCGIPKHKFDEYTQKLINRGYNVTLAEKNSKPVLIQSSDTYTKSIDENRENIIVKDNIEPPLEEIQTSMGAMPIDEYRDIMAMQNGFDSYEDMRSQGVKFGNEYDTDFAPETVVELEEQNSNDGLIGKKLTIDNRQYLIEGVRSYGDVELRDITFENAVGFPINRLENGEYIRKLLAEKEKSDLSQGFDEKSTDRAKPFDLHPNINQSERNQYAITNNGLGVGTAKEKFRANISAIKTLKMLENKNRFATPEEQDILSKYVGWGGLADAFDESKTAWASEYRELANILDETEYTNARESTLTAFYTAPTVISSMYKALENMGFNKGNILEPSCGTGNFIGMLPETMKESKVYGVELDSISGRIAQQLYQKSSIAVQGYETTNLPDSFFDVAIGNVPFGQFKVADKKYNKHNWLIHDYFFGKTLDKVRPGGVVAFITSKGTLDKENSAVRKYLAQRADLLGAIRLPNNAFKANAGTEVTSDIIFLQKRDRIIDIEPDWVYLGKDENGLKINQYFVHNPEMVMGEMKEISGPYGPETACIASDNQCLEDMLSDAIGNIHAEIESYDIDNDTETDIDSSVPADLNVRNFSFTVLNGEIYFRENSKMSPVVKSDLIINRIKGMIEIRDCIRNLIDYQTEDYPEDHIKSEQSRLNTLYDKFTKKYGLISSRANNTAFCDDSSYALLSALEVVDENGNLERKADIFTKRTIKPKVVITHADTSVEALAVSLSEKAKVDIEYMSKLTGKDVDIVTEELTGIIFKIPTSINSDRVRPIIYHTADEYLSGNVREKLALAQIMAESDQSFEINVTALQKVQPEDLSPSEISVRLGSTWVPPKDIQKFVFEILETPRYARWGIETAYSSYTATWSIQGKNKDSGNIKANTTYGTTRMNAYKIIEETLNLKDVRIFDYIEDAEGKKTAVLNAKETEIAQSKQEIIKEKFKEWIWQDPDRRERLSRLYNDMFNSVRPREYDGSHLTFSGMNPEIELREHQVNAIARILYGGNTLLAHEVGAGKTFEMVAGAMESKKIGLCNKSLFVVPNHIIEQWSSEFLQLYPSANILVSTKKDFEPKNRKKFVGRIATGDYDAVIIGHSQFEKIPLSFDRQRKVLEQQLNEIVDGLAELKRNKGDKFSVKELERTKKNISLKLNKLNDQSRKDDVLTFEELGVDRLFVDEAHNYKNLFYFTKMRNVGGIAQVEAQKSSDLFMKCRYLDEITDEKGSIFATGTPVSNSMVELYTMQRYLQFTTLQKRGLSQFDCWASTFGETVTASELAPEGTGYRPKTRFSKFYNLPELMCMFKEIADIQTSDTLNLPVPKANYHNIAVKPSSLQKDIVAELAERAEDVRNGKVDSSVDNLLKITNDGRKLALDQRLVNNLLPDFDGSKTNECVKNVYRIWEETRAKKTTQLVFCDLSTPKSDGSFSVYSDMRDKMIKLGIPKNEIAFIHDANNEVKKAELFSKVRKGDVRIVFGSTAKMGAGTNVQTLLGSIHNIDCPWRPSDLTQRSGRIVRQGNTNEEVDIYRYVTEETFDAYLYQLVEGKQKFISQIMTSKTPVRTFEDIDESALSYAEIKALATGNPFIKEKMDLDVQITKLKLLKQNHLHERYSLEDKLLKIFPRDIKALEERIVALKDDNEIVKKNSPKAKDSFLPMKIKDTVYTKKADAGQAILDFCKVKTSTDLTTIGEYRGFKMSVEFDRFSMEYVLTIQNNLSHITALGTDVHGNITRIDNVLDNIENKIAVTIESLNTIKKQVENAENEVKKQFPHEKELSDKIARSIELEELLTLGNKQMDDKDCTLSKDETSIQAYCKDKGVNFSSKSNEMVM